MFAGPPERSHLTREISPLRIRSPALACLASISMPGHPPAAMPPSWPPPRVHAWGRLRGHGEEARSFLVDLAIVVGLCGLLYGLSMVGGEWAGRLRPTVDIDLSPLALPRYTFFSLSRGLLAYLLSLAFTLGYGYWA